MKIIKYILKYGIDTNLKDGLMQTPLHLALSHYLCDVSSALIVNEEYQFCADVDGNTEYHKWVNHACLKCLNLLLNKKPDYKRSKNNKGNNPLHQAVIENNIEALQLLLENCDFSLDESGEHNHNLIQLSCLYSELVKIILINYFIVYFLPYINPT